MNPVLLKLGPLQVHWYGLLIVLGAVFAAWVATKEAERRGEDPEHVWNLLIWVLILGIIGARLYHVFSTPTGNFAGWAYYREHPIDIIAFWNGGFRGLGIYGAVLGGVVGVIIYVLIAKDRDGKPAHLSLLRWLDIPTPGLIVAQAIGRMGNFINQELYGPPTNAPWAFHINPTYPCQEPTGSPMACGIPDRLSDAARQWYAQNGFHPTFFYEAIWNVIGFGLLLFIGRRFKKWLRDGDIFFMYLLWYPVGRFWVEMFRPDAWRIGSLATAQWIAIGAFLLGLLALFVNHRRPAKAGPAVGPAGSATPRAAPGESDVAVEEKSAGRATVYEPPVGPDYRDSGPDAPDASSEPEASPSELSEADQAAWDGRTQGGMGWD